MDRKILIIFISLLIFTMFMIIRNSRKSVYTAYLINPISIRNIGIYEKYFKRLLDIICALLAISIFSPLYIIIAILVKVKLGSPVLFKQDRPGLLGKDGRETIFQMYKFRTMTDEKDSDGRLLPDELRLTKFGKWLRKTSLDELPEAFNILNGTMSVIGPRPQLVRDLVFMSDVQRQRHTAKPGLSGLAQVNGRNSISWEDKLKWDLKYIDNINLSEDIKIVFKTIKKAFIHQEGISQGEMSTAEDFGDYLLGKSYISDKDYKDRTDLSDNILDRIKLVGRDNDKVSIIMPSYNTDVYISKAIDSVLRQSYKNWELLIIDDCSTDSTEEILKYYLQDSRIHYFRNDENLGAALSRNKGLRLSRGRWIAFLDSDDIWDSYKLEKQIKFMTENNYCFSYTKYIEVSEDGDMTGVLVTGPKVINRNGMFNYCWPGCLTVMYDSSKIGQIQVSDIKKNNDYAMWLKITPNHRCYLLNEALAYYRRGRKGSISSLKITSLVIWHYKLFRYEENLGKFKSVLCTLRNIFFGIYKKIRYVKLDENN